MAISLPEGIKATYKDTTIFDLGLETGRPYFRGAILNGRVAAIPQLAYSFKLDYTEVEANATAAINSPGDIVYLAPYIYVISQTGSPQTLKRVNPSTMAVTSVNLTSMSPKGICTDGTYIWVTGTSGANKKLYKIDPADFGGTPISYDLNSTTPKGICWDGTYL